MIPALFEVFRHNGDRQALAGLYSIVAEAGMGDYQLNFGAALAELIKPQDEQNLARHKLTYQSSTAPRSKSRNPVAGVARAVSGVLNGDSGFHTKVEIRPWWMVDLGDVCLIRRDSSLRPRCLA